MPNILSTMLVLHKHLSNAASRAATINLCYRRILARSMFTMAISWALRTKELCSCEKDWGGLPSTCVLKLAHSLFSAKLGPLIPSPISNNTWYLKSEKKWGMSEITCGIWWTCVHGVGIVSARNSNKQWPNQHKGNLFSSVQASAHAELIQGKKQIKEIRLFLTV